MMPPAVEPKETTMNVHYVDKTANTEIIQAAIEDAREFINKEAMHLWDLCNCINDLEARDAVEDLVGLFDQHSPDPEMIASSTNQIIMPLLMIPFALVDMIEQEVGLNGSLGNAIKYYGPRLTDISTRIQRASQGG
jgi:hypothetical protein